MSDDPTDEVRARFADAETIGGDASDPPPPEDRPPEEFDFRAGAAFDRNDIGNAGRIVTYFGADLMHVPRVGWFVWSGRHWEKDPDNLRVRTRGQRLSELIEREVRHVELEEWQQQMLNSIPGLKARIDALSAIEKDSRTAEQVDELEQVQERHGQAVRMRSALSQKRSKHRDFAKSSGNSERIEKALKEAQVKLAQPLEALDADPLAVNVGNGTLRFKVTRGEGFSPVAEVVLEEHAREARQSKLIPWHYDPKAEAPQFMAFLERIQPNADIRSFLQRWFGLSMTGLTGEQKFAFFYGTGANGKSVLVDLIAELMGDYATTAKIESLTGQTRRGGGDATPDLIPLMGARFVRASEPDQGEKLKEGTIKELTGGEPIMVRALHSDFVEVKPDFKLTISGNYRPEIRGTDDGIWRRVLLVLFDVFIPAEQRDPDLGKKLLAEAPGILRWMVEGLLDYLEGGLREPDEVLAATAEYRADSDPMRQFLEDCTVVTGAESDFMLSRDLIEAFNVWNEAREGVRWGGRTVSNHLKAKASQWRHPATGKSFMPAKRQATGYRGIRLTEVHQRHVDEAGRSGARPRDAGGNEGEVPI